MGGYVARLPVVIKRLPPPQDAISVNVSPVAGLTLANVLTP
jgi:hypothetical protein